ncbi:MFS transporter [Novosphingobium taihuense]|uniref:MFS family permease n=1 Tax=Novosphingobium taihuense TaxID=260085 RepID=A0A7W7ESH1_9SPHN|nr:MFS transporter [Novosphingobium taihuense]MBB4612273.1 MFS family permease [Novosphingobium taihuense]TWH88373.1 putative MFS family arabinose efflux permease [Novosphingobium taihuense]
MTNARSEFRNGWRVVVGGFLGVGIGVSSIYFYSLGIFLKPLAAEFGWSRGEASLGPLVGTTCAALMAIPVGRLIDRIGSERLAVVSLTVLAAAFALLGWATSGLASFLTFTVILSLLTAGSSPMPFTQLVVASFERARGMALGLVLAGTGLGSILIPAFLPGYIASNGWRAGYFLLAGMIAILLPLVALLLRSSSPPMPQRNTSRPFQKVIANAAFAELAVIFGLASVAVLGTVVHFVPMLTDAGLTPARAGQFTALIGVAAVCGRLATGWLLDRVQAERVVAGLFVSAACGLVLLALGGPALIPAGAVVIGLCVGAEVDLISYLVARDFDRSDYGQAYGALYTVFLVGGAVGPGIAGATFDATGNYHIWLWLAATMLVVAGVISARKSSGDVTRSKAR